MKFIQINTRLIPNVNVPKYTKSANSCVYHTYYNSFMRTGCMILQCLLLGQAGSIMFVQEMITIISISPTHPPTQLARGISQFTLLHRLASALYIAIAIYVSCGYSLCGMLGKWEYSFKLILRSFLRLPIVSFPRLLYSFFLSS